ncbi:MAG: M48 family metalloprotease [Pseudomonadota bacterium]
MKLSTALTILLVALAFGRSTANAEHETKQPTPDAALSMAELSARVVEGFMVQGRMLPLPAALRQTESEVQAWFPNQPFELRLIDDPVPNARALPRGDVLLNLGLLLDLENPSELKFVLAHEVAHMALGHFAKHVRAGFPSRSEPLELEADELALDKLRLAALSTATIPELLRRTRQRGAEPVLPAPNTPFSERWGELAQPVLMLQRLALEQLLAADNIARADAFLQRHAEAFSAEELARWRWMISQRRATSPPDDRALEPPSLPGVLNRLPSRSGQCAPTPNVVSSTTTEGRLARLGKLRVEHPSNWRVALKTGRQLVLTPDLTGLTRLDVWSAGNTPRGTSARQLPCPSSQHTLWHAATEFRALEPERRLTLLDAAETSNGVALDMAMTDESGVRWRLTGWRLERSGEAVYVLYRAPERLFFGRHREAAASIVAGASLAR